MDQLTQLKAMTVVSADTADLDAFGELQPHDATTNPTFIAQVAPDPRYAALVEEALQYAKANSSSEKERLEVRPIPLGGAEAGRLS
jgi:transaldolase